MIYGEEKAKQMARSILPSSSRKSARFDKASAKRKVRHNVKQKIQVEPDWDDTALDDEADMWEIVFDRRLADKTSPAERWAERVVKKKSIPKADRVKWLESVFPNNLAGQHAVYGHLVYVDGIKPEHDHERRWYRISEEEQSRRNRVRRNELIEIKKKLQRLVDKGYHKEFNRRVKEKSPGRWEYPKEAAHLPWRELIGVKQVWVQSDVRLFHGIHDIDDFAPLCVETYHPSLQCRILAQFDV